VRAHAGKERGRTVGEVEPTGILLFFRLPFIYRSTAWQEAHSSMEILLESSLPKADAYKSTVPPRARGKKGKIKAPFTTGHHKLRPRKEKNGRKNRKKVDPSPSLCHVRSNFQQICIFFHVPWYLLPLFFFCLQRGLRTGLLVILPLTVHEIPPRAGEQMPLPCDSHAKTLDVDAF